MSISGKYHGDMNVDPKKILEKAAKDDIISKVPEAAPYRDSIKFIHSDGHMDYDLSSLPQDLQKKIYHALGRK